MKYFLWPAYIVTWCPLLYICSIDQLCLKITIGQVSLVAKVQLCEPKALLGFSLKKSSTPWSSNIYIEMQGYSVCLTFSAPLVHCPDKTCCNNPRTCHALPMQEKYCRSMLTTNKHTSATYPVCGRNCSLFAGSKLHHTVFDHEH